MEISDMWDSLITEIEKLEEKYKLSQNCPKIILSRAIWNISINIVEYITKKIT